MRWPNWSGKLEYRIRAVLLAVAVLASVALPYSIIQRGADSTLVASAWLVRSAQVKEMIYELKSSLNDLESLVLSLFVQIPRENAREKYYVARARIQPLLEKLGQATRDDPDQQNRIGALRAVVDGRLTLFDTAMSQIEKRNYDAAGQALRQAAQLFASRAAADAIIAAEDRLYEARTERMRLIQRDAHWTVIGALLAQLVLLGSVIFVSERQVQRRHLAEALARQAVERSRVIVQSLREPIAVLSPSLQVLMTNEAFTEFYGNASEGKEKRSLGSLGGGAWDDAMLLQRLLDVGARGREIWDFEMSQQSADGIGRVVLVNARRMGLSDDEDSTDPRTILLTVNDVTARKRYEQQISELNSELESRVAQVSEINRELEAFSYSVSHDLRAPLRHIAGFADKLGSHLGESADEKARHYLGVIAEASRRMSRLIEDLLEYSRLGRNAFHVTPVDMDALVREVSEMLQVSHEDRSIEWKLEALPACMGDESMLRRVWQNLLGNAVKYTSGRERAHIEVGTQPRKNGETVYFVRDNGVGFDMAYAGKLFGVFQRLHKASEFPGTGIGLANVRRIIGRHGGRVWAQAEPDKGATLFFSLPALPVAIESKGNADES